MAYSWRRLYLVRAAFFANENAILQFLSKKIIVLSCTLILFQATKKPSELGFFDNSANSN
jgi:hypothetical protein